MEFFLPCADFSVFSQLIQRIRKTPEKSTLFFEFRKSYLMNNVSLTSAPTIAADVKDATVNTLAYILRNEGKAKAIEKWQVLNEFYSDQEWWFHVVRAVRQLFDSAPPKVSSDDGQSSTEVNFNAPVYISSQQPDGGAPDVYTDEQIARALTAVVGEGRAIDCKQKWAGALWLLRWRCNFPAKAQDFCQRVNALPFEQELAIKCEYNNIRQLSTLSFMNEDARQLDSVKYSKRDEQMFFQLRSVVVELDRELQKTRSWGGTF